MHLLKLYTISLYRSQSTLDSRGNYSPKPPFTFKDVHRLDDDDDIPRRIGLLLYTSLYTHLKHVDMLSKILTTVCATSMQIKTIIAANICFCYNLSPTYS